jgi:trans-2,3-dihydro-3-hydroxyanthranilate isomerase
MDKLKYYVVDVFAERKYAGNQLAVFRNAQSLTAETMQKIAREINFSETTFILSDSERDGGYDVRIFTPKRELPFAGHPTLGTSYIIQHEIVKKPIEKLTLNLKVGQIPVTFSYKNNQADILFMQQLPPTFGKTVDANDIAEVLSISVDDIDSRFPIQEVSTGVPDFMVPLKNLAALKKCRINAEKYFRLIEKYDSKAILIFSPEPYTPGNDLSVRFFADYFGVPEDPATGSANGCLAGYLVEYRYFGEDRIDIRVEQGYEIDRPSLLYLKAERSDDKIIVNVGGRVIKVAEGEFV